jgi:hypothetical protein
MATLKAKVAPTHNKVILPSVQRCASLQEAVNQFLLWEMRSRDCIKVKRCYIDVAQDLEAGVLLSQIIYWHLPDKEGEQKLTVQRDGHWWLAKAREDWWDECRLTPKQFDRAIRYLEAKQLVCTKVYKWQGQNTKHIRVDWAGLLQALSMLDANTEKVVGFRRREPTQNVCTPQGNSGKRVSSELPNSQSSRFPISQSGELPNSQSLGFPISQSLDSLLGNSQIPQLRSSELPNREFNYIDPEITSETTSTDYSSPLTLQGVVQAGIIQLGGSFFDSQASNTRSLEEQPQQSKLQRQEVAKTRSLVSQQERSQTPQEQATDLGWGKSSAPTASDENSCSQPIETAVSHVATEVLPDAEPIGSSQERDRDQYQQRSRRDLFTHNQPQLPKNIDGSDRLPWETEHRGKFNPDFEKWMAQSLMQYPAFQKLMAGELQIKVRKHISAGKYDLKRRDELFIEWEAMGSGVNVGKETYGVTAKAVSRRAKIRSAVCS